MNQQQAEKALVEVLATSTATLAVFADRLRRMGAVIVPAEDVAGAEPAWAIGADIPEEE